MGNPFFRARWRVLICIRIVTDMQMERLRKKRDGILCIKKISYEKKTVRKTAIKGNQVFYTL
jgi:hypothetical protein